MTSVFSRLQRSPAGPRAAYLKPSELPAAQDYLSRDSQLNLQLLDMVEDAARAVGPRHFEPVLLAAWEEGEVVGVAALRPSLLFDAHLEPRVLHAFLPYLGSVETGLIKSLEQVATPLWEILRDKGRRSLIDRHEIAFALRPDAQREVAMPSGACFRLATPEDLPALVYAARASLREEGRPDPAEYDPTGFERWVRGRLDRARIIEFRERVAFVLYADVRRPEGWLVQGVFTWPEVRQRGLAGAGLARLAFEAFEAGAEHVQLAVVEGNAAGLALYESLGFRPFARLRTVLFA